VLPEIAQEVDMNLSTTLMEAGGSITTHLASLLDEYENLAQGEIYTLELSLTGESLVFDENGEQEIVYNTVEGYKAFQLRSTDQSGNTTLRFRLKDM
jgi:hypothetical protein